MYWYDICLSAEVIFLITSYASYPIRSFVVFWINCRFAANNSKYGFQCRRLPLFVAYNAP